MVNECEYESAFTFIFSPRVGTPAAKMKDNTSLKEKEDRLHRLNKVVNKYSRKANDKYLNKEVKVLLEGVSLKDENMLMGYSEEMKLVNVRAPKDKIGKIVPVRVTDVKTWSLDGEMV